MLFLTLIFGYIFLFSNVSICQKEIPRHILKELSQIKTIQELRQKFNISVQSNDFLSKDTLQGSLEMTSDEELLEQAGCIPRSTTVPLPRSPPGYIYFPTCVELPRCGGCCGEVFVCKPTSSSLQDVKTEIFQLNSNYELEPVGYSVFPVEVDHECDCVCRVQAKDCNELQIYNADSCECNCRNSADMFSCVPPKRWSHSQCACACPFTIQCNSNEIFSFATCNCELSTVTPSKNPTMITPSDVCASKACRPNYKPQFVSAVCSCVPKK